MMKPSVKPGRLFVTLFVCLSFIGLTGCGSEEAAPTTADDLQNQLSQQFKQQWPAGSFLSVEIEHFEKPAADNEMVIGLNIQWDKQNSTSTSMTLYRAAERYYLGTFRLNKDAYPAQLQERVKLLPHVRIMLSFKDGNT